LLFAQEQLARLREATADLCWLLARGYAVRSAAELVGNRYSLAARQRAAVARCACSDESATQRASRQVSPDQFNERELWIDGLNVLTGIEVALSGGVILVGRDGCCRDVAGVHRHYRKVEETVPALQLIGKLTSGLGFKRCQWFLDKPVSNSGRLRSLILDLAVQAGWDWQAELVYSPDAVLARTDQIVATSDSAILDRCRAWLNLARLIIAERIPRAHLVDLSLSASS
jgi:hypothetical protein